MGSWGTEMEHDVVRKRQYTRYITANHVRYNWTKREVTSYRNDKKRNVERRKKLNAIPFLIIQFMTAYTVHSQDTFCRHYTVTIFEIV